MSTQPLAYLVEGFNQHGTVVGHRIFHDREEAEKLASVFVKHYPTVTITDLIRSQSAKPWAGLTLEEVWDTWDSSSTTPGFALAIERKLKERNWVTHQRKPLSAGQLEEIRWACSWARMSTSDPVMRCTQGQMNEFVRAIEAAHGIIPTEGG